MLLFAQEEAKCGLAKCTHEMKSTMQYLHLPVSSTIPPEISWSVELGVSILTPPDPLNPSPPDTMTLPPVSPRAVPPFRFTEQNKNKRNNEKR
jgi:hypothetical protein